MQVYVALFRGINVSGKNIIKMEDLRKQMETAGYEDVKTYIQSGNVVFKSKGAASQIAADIEQLVKAAYGHDITVIVLDKVQLLKSVNDNPYAAGREPEPAGTKKIYVTFLSEVPAEENIEKLGSVPIGEDSFNLKGDVLYLKLAQSAADTKLTNSLIENKLKVRATTRNWNTTLKLLEMVEDLGT